MVYICINRFIKEIEEYETKGNEIHNKFKEKEKFRHFCVILTVFLILTTSNDETYVYAYAC